MANRSTPKYTDLKLSLEKIEVPQSDETLFAQKNELPLSNIIVSPSQPRRYFDQSRMANLKESILQHGILEPLLVRKLEDEKFEIVAGERRFRAAQEIGLGTVPVVIREMGELEARQVALVENLQREDLNPLEETEAILNLLGLKLNKTIEEIVTLLYRMQNETRGKVTENVLSNPETQIAKEIFESLGKISWESFVVSRIPLLRLPEDILEALRTGKMEFTKAQAIARLKDSAARSILLTEAIEKKLSLQQIKARIQELQAPKKEPPSLKSRWTETNRMGASRFCKCMARKQK